MPYVYRYTDKADNIIKYVGIVHSTKPLEQRVLEHSKEEKFQGIDWKIEFINYPNATRTDLEMIESHLITLYETANYLNVAKTAFGLSMFIKGDLDGWEEYTGRKEYSVKKINKETAKEDPHYFEQFYVNDIELIDGKMSRYNELMNDTITQDHKIVRTFKRAEADLKIHTVSQLRQVRKSQEPNIDFSLWQWKCHEDTDQFHFWFMTDDLKMHHGGAHIAEYMPCDGKFAIIEPFTWDGIGECDINPDKIIGVWLKSRPEITPYGSLIPEYWITEYVKFNLRQIYPDGQMSFFRVHRKEMKDIINNGHDLTWIYLRELDNADKTA